MNYLRHPVIGLKVLGSKALTRMTFQRNPLRAWFAPLSRFDFKGKLGDGTSSSTVMAPLNWIAATFPEAPPMIWQVSEDGEETPRRLHPLLRLLERPNPYHIGPVLWMATLTDWYVDGNAYWIKVRDRAGVVRELWWAPHTMIEPKGNERDSSVYIDHYEYRPDSYLDPIKLKPADIVHFRCGLDNEDPRKGRSKLKSVLHEVYTDEEAAIYTVSLLRNMAVPGIVVSPDTDQPISQTDAEATKEYFAGAFTGDRRGESLVMKGRTRITQFGFSPEQLVLRDLRRIPEERVSAALGVPAIVAGLGAGLDRSTFTNYTEAREAAYEQTIIPTQRLLAEEIRFQLLNEFEADPHGWRVGFDLSQVRVLREDEDALARRASLLVREGLWTRAEGRRATGREVDPARDEVFILPMNTVEVEAATGLPRAQPDPPADSSTENGKNGNGDARAVAAELARELERAT